MHNTDRLRKKPRQSRAKDTRRKLLEAAAQLFAERGVMDTSTNRIAAHAGVSIGTLYRYFANRDEIVDVLRRQLIDELEEDFTVAALVGASLRPADSIAAGMRAVTSRLAVHADLVRALVAESTLQGSSLPEFERRLRRIVKTYLANALGQLPGQDLETMAFVISNAGLATCYRITAGDAIEMDYEKVITETAAMIGTWLVQTARSLEKADRW
ncbi:TetR/AcrR family transcriptional regulator [Nocardia sp. Marseille-Q1738]